MPFTMRLTLALFSCAALALGSLSGCRLGNRIEQPALSGDPLTGHYETTPRQLIFCASRTVNNDPNPVETCVEAPVNQIPSLISPIITNPIIFAAETETGRAAIASNIDPVNYQLNGYYYSDLSFEVAGATATSLAWDNSRCTYETIALGQGLLQQYPSHQTKTFGGQAFSIFGTMTLVILAETAFTPVTAGDCTQSMQSLSDCYNDTALCNLPGSQSEQHAMVQAIFDPYIQAGAMTAAEIPVISKLAYQILYQ